VHIRVPAVADRNLLGQTEISQTGIIERIDIGGPAGRVREEKRRHLLRSGGIEVCYVSIGSAANLDANWRDQGQMTDSGFALGCDLCSEPSTDRYSNQRYRGQTQRPKQV
jgi:hypothetical protein